MSRALSLLRACGAVGLISLLVACGFTPVYGPGGANTLRGAIELEEPNDRDAFAFVEAFEARLGLPAAPRFEMGYTIVITETGRAITGSNDITRFTVDGQLRYNLRPIGEDIVISSGALERFTSYAATGSTIATLAAQRDARARLMQIFADQIAQRLEAENNLR